jgi:hypothetical protein
MGVQHHQSFGMAFIRIILSKTKSSNLTSEGIFFRYCIYVVPPVPSAKLVKKYFSIIDQIAVLFFLNSSDCDKINLNIEKFDVKFNLTKN